MFSSGEINGKIAEKYPENLIFCDTETLLSVAEDSWNSITCRANCLAELLIRLYLNREETVQIKDGKTTLRKQVASILSHGEVAAFLYAVMPLKSFKPDNAKRLALWSWNDADDLSLACRAALRKRLRTFFRADGVIPVQSGDNRGWMIPFDLEKGESEYAVSDLEGKVIDEWNDAVSKMKIASYRVRVHCYAAQMSNNPSSFIGRSLMLPVWTAFQKKEGNLPDYNPFKFILSGAFDQDGLLSKVDINGKAAELVKHYRDAIFLIPESCDISGLDVKSPNIHALPNELMEDLIPSVKREVEQSQELTLDYAIRRLPSLCDDVRYYHHGDWNEIIRILEATAKFDKDDNPMEYLLNLSLQSEAHCHNGNTKKALELNEKAYAFATEREDNEFVRVALRLQICKLVLLTDEENFEEIAQISPELEQRLEKSGDTGLLMRYHGTMGQFCAYGTLAGVHGCSKEQSLEHFKKAKEYAYKSGKLEDKRQDLNYLHLWHALFVPGTEAEEDALEVAEKKLSPQGEEKENSDNIIRNKTFLLRQKLLADYRALLVDKEIKKWPSFNDVNPLLEGCDHSWIRALSYKYLGALESEAAQRETDDSASEEHKKNAIQCFEIALQPLNESGPIIDLIRLTIRCEAFRSTNDFRYQEMALKLVKPLRETYPNQKSIDQWERFLQGQGNFPGLDYWY